MNARNIAALIVAKAKPKEMVSESETDTQGEMMSQAAEEIMAAVEAKDAVALKEALMAFIEMC